MNCSKKGKLFVIAGPSGVGKGTLVTLLLEKNPEISFSVSVTTRKPRPGEVHGVNYFFVEREKFQEMIEEGRFLEWAEFAGNLYGTDIKIVRESLSHGQNILLEIDIQGALQVIEREPEAVMFFIEPPSFEELKARLVGRKTESEEDVQKRLAFAKSELEQKDKFKYRITNDNLDEAYQELEKIVRHELNGCIR